MVHRDVVDDVIAIFADLQRQRYPIERMQTVDRYPGAQDELSMEDNNTSAFNCRPPPGNTGWSFHAYGRAVDVNPLINPTGTAAVTCNPRLRGSIWTAPGRRRVAARGRSSGARSPTGLAVGAAPGAIPLTTNTSRSAELLQWPESGYAQVHGAAIHLRGHACDPGAQRIAVRRQSDQVKSAV